MTLYEAVVKHLKANAGVLAIVGSKVFPDLPEVGTLPPYAVVSVIAPRPLMAHDGPDPLNNGRISVTCWDKTSIGASVLATAVQKVLNGFRGTLGGPGGVTVGSCILTGSWPNVDPSNGLRGQVRDFATMFEEII